MENKQNKTENLVLTKKICFSLNFGPETPNDEEYLMFIFSKDEQRGYILTLQTYHQSENKYKQTQHELREAGTIRKWYFVTKIVLTYCEKKLF